MDLRKRILTENNCYKAGEKITVKGLMVHSTGAENPNLSRYVDAPELDNISDNHWNQPKPDGQEKCVHGFIGLDGKDVATYQTLDWNHRGWGGGGKSNNTHIHIEICEGDLDDEEYFKAVYKEAVELFAYLCDKFNLNPEEAITTHSEGHKNGIASNHADVMHWFPKHGKDMDDFRADVRDELGDSPKATPKSTKKTIDQLATEVIKGVHGSGADRKKSLGNQYDEVQSRVNQMLVNAPKVAAPKPRPKTTDQLAREVIDGLHGSGPDRKKSLGGRYKEVQARVNELLGTPKSNTSKSVSQLADEVLKGQHGNGRDRMRSLGDKYAAVQAEVTRRLRKR